MSLKPRVYAELLANIRQVSIVAELPTPTSSASNTFGEVSSDGLQLKVSHCGQTATISLPAAVSPSKPLRQSNGLGSCEVTWRLPTSRIIPQEPDGPLVPWCADDLASNAICCRDCKRVIVADGAIKSWRDLPSENWAEMMDFWHCHKPVDHEPHGDDHFKNRGHGANAAFLPRPGLGFVDLTYFLLVPTDCHVQVFDEDVLCCCGTNLGRTDRSALRINKWNISIGQSMPLSYFLTAHLLAQIASQATSKFMIFADSCLYVWVFAPRIIVSSGSATHAMKLFYKVITPSEKEAILEQANLSVGEINLSSAAMEELKLDLFQSTSNLPPSVRQFKEWRVGLLERYAGRQVSPGKSPGSS